MHTKKNISPQLYWLVHPLALALYVFLILLYFIPDYFQKYEADVVSSKASAYTNVYHEDLNNDNVDEQLITAYNEGNVAKFLFRTIDGRTINQWNFRGKWLGKHHEVIGDYNNDNLKEVYFLTIDNDSLFLSIIEPFAKQELVIKDRYISEVGKFSEGDVYASFVDGKLIDVNDDGLAEYVFIIYAGYSKYPRKVFVYDIYNNELESSPESAAGLSIGAHFLDVNNDGIEEVCGKVTAHENIHYPMPYSDSSAWLMVFDLKDSIDFLFPPIEFKTGIGSEVYTVPFNIGGQGYLASTFTDRSLNPRNNYLQLKLYNTNGNLIKKASYPSTDINRLFFHNNGNNRGKWFYLFDNAGNIYYTDTTLRLSIHFENQIQPFFLNPFDNVNLDLDEDGLYESVFITSSKNVGVFIYSSDMNDAVYLDLPELNQSSNRRLHFKKPSLENPSNLIFNSHDRTVYIRYAKNPIFVWKYPLYTVLYLFLFLIFWLLQKVQRAVVASRYETEKQLLQQQMALSKKQMEPHFMLNTVNNIGYLFLKEDKKKAMFYLGKFAALMRRGLMNVDKIATSLEEELEFVEDYLVLQKQLMDGELNYEIKLEENIEEDKIQIPHSLIYTFAENAIKHGLRPKIDNRILSIQVSKVDHHTKISITDNGVGRAKSKELNTTDTGKGMEIVKTIIAGYNQLHGGNISYSVEDVLEDSDVKGTLVEIWV